MRFGGVKKIYNSKSRTFLLFCFCFITGVGIFSALTINFDWQFVLFCTFLVAILCLIFFGQKSFVRYVLICLMFFVLGGLRFYLSVPSNSSINLSHSNGQFVFFDGLISSEVVSNGSGSQAVVSATKINRNLVSGKVRISLPMYTEYKFGDQVRIGCNLKTPEGQDSFLNYDKYLARQGIYSLCAGQFRIYKIGESTSWLVKLVAYFYNIKNSLQHQVDKLWPEPAAALAAGLLYGARSNLDAQVSADFTRIGLTHIIAVSGYNISVVSAVFLNCLIMLGLNRRRAFYFSMFAIILFVLFTGASASVVRAGIMGMVVLLSTQLGRVSQAGNILIFTAAIMLLFNPYVLIWDVGFQLSFLSTLGLIYLSPLFNNYISGKINNIYLKNLIEQMNTTFSAIIMTLPLVLFQFGRLSLVAPLSNLLILWIIPFLMLSCFAAIIMSYAFFPLGMLVAWVAYLGLKYVIITAHWLSGWSWASTQFNLSLWAMIFIYILLMYIVYDKNKNIKISDRV